MKVPRGAALQLSPKVTLLLEGYGWSRSEPEGLAEGGPRQSRPVLRDELALARPRERLTNESIPGHPAYDMTKTLPE